MRHRQHQLKEINPKFLPLSKTLLLHILEKLRLPYSYLYMRGFSGASGNFGVVRDGLTTGKLLA